VMKNRCECCNKKVGLMGFKCRCGKTFCGVHRYVKEHSCTFDFKTYDRQNLAKQNPLVAGDKLHTRIWCSIWSFYLHLIFVVCTYLYMNLIKKFVLTSYLPRFVP
jgi:hypothetical protein